MRMNVVLKKPTNLSIDKSVLLDAKALGVNLSQAAEAGIKKLSQTLSLNNGKLKMPML